MIDLIAAFSRGLVCSACGATLFRDGVARTFLRIGFLLFRWPFGWFGDVPLWSLDDVPVGPAKIERRNGLHVVRRLREVQRRSLGW